MPIRSPSPAELVAAAQQTLPDVLAPDLDVVFCGINPSLYSAAVGHHFARPGNRFWPALHRAGWTETQLDPRRDRELLRHGGGLTNICLRPTARADELSTAELRQGAQRLERMARRLRPRGIAFLGLGAYRTAFGSPARPQRRAATPGAQPDPIAGARVWVLPNPSGLNAHYRLDDFVRLFEELRRGMQER